MASRRLRRSRCDSIDHVMWCEVWPDRKDAFEGFSLSAKRQVTWVLFFRWRHLFSKMALQSVNVDDCEKGPAVPSDEDIELWKVFVTLLQWLFCRTNWPLLMLLANYRLSRCFWSSALTMRRAVSMFVWELASTRSFGTTQKSCMLCIDYYFKSCMCF